MGDLLKKIFWSKSWGTRKYFWFNKICRVIFCFDVMQILHFKWGPWLKALNNIKTRQKATTFVEMIMLLINHILSFGTKTSFVSHPSKQKKLLSDWCAQYRVEWHSTVYCCIHTKHHPARIWWWITTHGAVWFFNNNSIKMRSCTEHQLQQHSYSLLD